MWKILKNKDFTLYFTGRLISNIAQYSLLFLGALFIIDKLGDVTIQSLFSSFVVGAMILFYPLAIVLTKTWKKVRVLVISDLFSSATIFAGTIMLFSLGETSDVYMQVGIVAIVTGLVSISISFFNSASGGILPYILSDQDFAKGSSLISFILTTSNVLGLIVSGIMYETMGLKETMLILGSLYAVSAFTEMFIKLNDEETHPKNNTKNIIKLYGKSLKDTKRALFNFGDASKILWASLLGGIFISSYHQIISPYLVKIHLGFSGSEGTFYLSIFKSLTSIGAMIGSLLVANLISKKFAQASAKVSLIFELPLQFGWAFVIFLFDQNITSAYNALVLSAFIMLFRTMFGNMRMGAVRIGQSNAVDKKDIVIFDTQFRFIYSLTEVPSFILIGFIASNYGVAASLFFIACFVGVTRFIGLILVKNVKYKRDPFDKDHNLNVAKTRKLKIKEAIE